MSRRTWTAVFSAITSSSKMAELPDNTCRLFFHQLLQRLDSWGCIDAKPHKLLAEVWPLFGMTAEETQRCVLELERVGLIELHTDGAREWIACPDWDDKAGSMIRTKRRGVAPYPTTRETRKKPARAKRVRPQASDALNANSNATPALLQRLPLVSTLSSLSSLPVTVEGSPRVTQNPEAAPVGADGGGKPDRAVKGPRALRTDPPLDLTEHHELDTPEFQATWSDWVRYRREKKAPLTETGARHQLKGCARMGVARSIAALHHTMAMGWQGMREPDEQHPSGHTPAGASTAPGKRSARDAIFGTQPPQQPRDVRAEVIREAS